MKRIKLITILALLLIGAIQSGAIAQGLEPGSNVFLVYVQSEDRSDVDGSDALGMLKTQIDGKTNLNVVNELDDAEFVIEFTAVKSFADNRRAKITVKGTKSDTTVFETKWVRGTSNAFSGFSGTRNTIQKITKQLIDKYPKIAH